MIYKNRTQLKLETLEGAQIFENGDDTLLDKHGCPAYVSPEVLTLNAYSGCISDCWSAGVILYTMLVGRYPFHDNNPSVVFHKIRRGVYIIPGNLSGDACSLIASLIKLNPEARLKAEDALEHPWFSPKPTVNELMMPINQNQVFTQFYRSNDYDRNNYVLSLFRPTELPLVPEYLPLMPNPNRRPPTSIRSSAVTALMNCRRRSQKFTHFDQIVPDLSDDE